MGPKIERRSDVDESIISEGLIAGAIQVPGDGKPIIILAELVTGGYTKIATVISTDLSKVAQLKPGDRVRFAPISVGERPIMFSENKRKDFRVSKSHSRHDRKIPLVFFFSRLPTAYGGTGHVPAKLPTAG